ncbi:MAG: RNA polymerase sigma factor [Brevundimonas sp.]|uniref:RNA polymerase sigma factor n=1 Tax=Brevundimonas sp. TaxID=1871086 RepID=UPI00391B2284
MLGDDPRQDRQIWLRRVQAARLVDDARRGERAALSLLVRTWTPKLGAHAWRLLGDADEAREAVSGSWARIIEALPALRDAHAFPAFAYRMVTRQCAAMVGAKVRQRALHSALRADEGGSDKACASADSPERAAETDALHRAIRALPPDQRAAITLHYFEDMSVAEIAVALDTPAGTVKTRLLHARARLRLALQGD